MSLGGPTELIEFHVNGDRDPDVPLKQAELLDARMNEVGAPHVLPIKKDAGHGLDVDEEVWKFLDGNLK